MASLSAIPFGHAPTPSLQAASSMFCAARPASKETGPLPPTMTAITSAAPRTLSPAHTAAAVRSRASGEATTTNRQGWRFCELPLTRPASRMRCSTSGGIGRSA